jgi:REP element-mobilizing transposase RayT
MKDIFEQETYYHVFNHAIGKENLFHTTENYYYFLKKYVQYISPVIDTLAYCLMPNHFHLLIKVKPEQTLLMHYRFLALEKNNAPRFLMSKDSLTSTNL